MIFGESAALAADLALGENSCAVQDVAYQEAAPRLEKGRADPRLAVLLRAQDRKTPSRSMRRALPLRQLS